MKIRNSLVLASFFALIAVFGFTFAGAKAKKTAVHGVGWYASFEDAKAEAKKTGKPILFLSMFGRLDEEMPCANARTLRATLFADPEFKKLITENAIPAWEMVRAVPKIEIDLGDGNKIKRTVRGNAVMYLCNSEGRVVDAFPGVYTPEDFMPMVRESIAKLAKADFETIHAYHKERGAIPRRTAITTGKMMLEAPTLNLIGAPAIEGTSTRINTKDPDELKFLQGARMLSDASLTPMPARETMLALTGSSTETRSAEDIAAQIRRNDSKANMERTRPVVHLYFASLKAAPTPSEARDAILETILKIPYKDPYFGLKDVLLPGTPG
jgi:hypothetical protein